MKTGKCPKCDSTNVYKNNRGMDWGSGWGWLEIWIGTPKEGSSRQSESESYICTDCGYFENYLLDREILREVQAKWAKAA